MGKIRVGILGAGRGAAIGRSLMLAGAEIVALCEERPERIDTLPVKVLGGGFTIYNDFDKFIEHPMDAVVLANNFHQHAPYAIRCLEKGIHVFSECISNGTMAEGAALVRAAKKSNAIYMLAENYPHMLFNREIKRVCDSGTLGKILYAEGEYNHPHGPVDVGFLKEYTYYPEHWRNYDPRTYYVTHSLAPIMHATGAVPKRVTAFAVFCPDEREIPSCSRVGDRAAIITTQNNDGSVFRFTGCAAFGAHHNAYRVCGTEGSIENIRGLTDQVMLRYNEWSVPEGALETQLYTPGWNDKDEELIQQSGHGGGDYLVGRMFLDCIREGKQPEAPFDVYSATTMASVAILAHRSVLENGIPYDIPDFRNEEDCVRYENDWLTPFPGENGEAPTLPCCSVPDYKPTETQKRLYREMVLGEKI